MVLSDTQKQIVKINKDLKKCKQKEEEKKSLVEKNKKELADKKKPKIVMKGKAKLTKEQKEKLSRSRSERANKEGKKIGRPKGAKTILNFSKLKKEGMKRLFNELNIMGPYGRVFGPEDYTIPQLRKWLKWLINTDDFSPLPEEIKAIKEKDEFNSVYPFYTPNWYTYPSNNKNERYYEKDKNSEEKKKKYALKIQELNKEGGYMFTSYDTMILSTENKNITKSDLINKLNKFVEKEKQLQN
jgi:hypothetical protein